ncbi:MAG: hypothetical protein B7Y41_09860 [Hydrogenophilales bacterium 28-61-23]|nr:MAG: hypothetical protein B7Y41_09860 [Hydrogenophilales bacterium 28-61-23]
MSFDFLPERLFPAHRLALLADRWVLRAAGGATPIEVEFDGDTPLPALETLLEKNNVSGRLRITLSHHHVRLFLAPAPPAWLNREEMLAWIGATLATTLGGLGDKSGGWQLAWDITPPGQPIVVAAVAETLSAGINALCHKRGIKLIGMRPWLAETWRRRSGQLAHATGWYALLEPGSQILLRLRRGRPVALRQRQTGADPAAELEALLARESLLADLPVGGPLWLERTGAGLDRERISEKLAARLGGRYALHELAGPTDIAQAMLQ